MAHAAANRDAATTSTELDTSLTASRRARSPQAASPQACRRGGKGATSQEEGSQCLSLDGVLHC